MNMGLHPVNLEDIPGGRKAKSAEWVSDGVRCIAEDTGRRSQLMVDGRSYNRGGYGHLQQRAAVRL